MNNMPWSTTSANLPPPPNKTQIPRPRSTVRTKWNFVSQIFLSNTRSVVSKLDEISETVTNNLCDIAVITESWLSSRVTDQLISIPGYESRRRDRLDHQRGSGLCTIINSRLDFVQLQELDDPDIESQWFVIKHIRLPRGINIILGTIYHPPQSDDNKLRAHLFNNLDTLLASHPNSAVLVMGDFNQFKPGNLCSSFKLKKLVTKPIRGSNILDQVYCTLSDPLWRSQILPSLGFSDHSSILLKPSSRRAPHLSCTRDQRRVCNTHNKCKLLSSLQAVNWSPMYHLDTCEDQLKEFQRVVTGAMNRCLPMRLVKRHPTDKPWITPEIKDAIKKRQRAWAKGNNHSYKIHRNRVIKLSKSGCRRFYNDKVNHMRDTNPKKWWDNIKLLSGLFKPATLTNITVNGTILRDTDLANAINESFCNVASDITPLEFTPIPVTQIPDEYSISPDEVGRSLSTIQERKSIGPDDIANWLL